MAHQLTFEERERISQMSYAGASSAEIAQTLGRHRATIGRELRRNSAGGEYSALVAQAMMLERRQARPLMRKMDHPELLDYVRTRLVQYWSPDQIAGRLKRELPRDRRRHISRQTVYDWIKSRPKEEGERFTSFLRRGGHRRPREDRRGCIANQVSIGGRPRVVDARRRYGDWEGDTIVGAQQSGAVVTLVERKSGYLMTAKSCGRSGA